MRKFVSTTATSLRWQAAITATLASGLAALAFALATPAMAAPSGLDGNGHNMSTHSANANGWLDTAGMTPYGTYQNDDPRKSASHR